MSVPVLTTQSASSIGMVSATGNGTIVSGSGITRRGFEYNTVQYEGGARVFDDGAFSAGAYTKTLIGLTPGATYYVRAYAVNADGEGFGGWSTFVATSPIYNVTINNIDRTSDILAETLSTNDVVNDQVNTCGFLLDDRSGNGIPNNDQEIIITLNNGEKLFAGYVVNVKMKNLVEGGGKSVADVQCVDYTRLLDRNLVHKTYLNMTDKAIIQAIIEQYCPGAGITTTNVEEGVTIDRISFNYIQPSQAFRKIAELTGRHWFIDYDKDVHYTAADTATTPFNITSTQSAFWGLEISKDASQIKNRVYVRGGTKLSEFTNYVTTGDGETRKFVLPDKPHDVTIEVDRGSGYIEESVGIKNVDTSGFKWYLNFQEKYAEQDSGETILSSTDKFRITYKYDIPILVAVEDTASIAENGVREFAIFDKTIATTQSARDRASSELIDYANDIIDGQFFTWETGFVTGQYININHAEYGVNADYVVQGVSAESIGAGHYVYTIKVASAKTLGIIKFLIKLLESNRNLVELDDDEVVDELLQLTDSLLSDSLLDSLVTDSTGPYFVYQNDSAPIDDPGIARYSLSQYRY